MNCRSLCFGERLKDGASSDHVGHADIHIAVPTVSLDLLPADDEPNPVCRKEELAAAREALHDVPDLSAERMQILKTRIQSGYYLSEDVAKRVASSLLPAFTQPLD